MFYGRICCSVEGVGGVSGSTMVDGFGWVLLWYFKLNVS